MFCDEEPEKLPWDYFLTQYERDLLTLTVEAMLKKYPLISKNEVVADLAELNVILDVR